MRKSSVFFIRKRAHPTNEFAGVLALYINEDLRVREIPGFRFSMELDISDIPSEMVITEGDLDREQGTLRLWNETWEGFFAEDLALDDEYCFSMMNVSIGQDKYEAEVGTIDMVYQIPPYYPPCKERKTNAILKKCRKKQGKSLFSKSVLIHGASSTSTHIA